MKKAIGTKTTTAAAVIAALGLGFGSVQLANADDPTTAPSSSASQGEMGRHGKMGGGDMAAELAEKLGLEQSAVETAMTEVRDELGRPERGSKPTDAEREARMAEETAKLAEKLGVSTEALTTALNEIKDARMAERQTAADEVIDQAVTDGKITADEATAVKKAVRAGVVGVRGGGPRR